MGKINFRWLAKKDLHKGKKFDIIKGISDTAAKEYAIRLTVEQVESELENTNLVVVKYKDCYILKNLNKDIANFVECDIKILSLSQNPYAKIYKDRIDRLIKELKRIISTFTTWIDLQKYWAYLLPIFCQKDIA